VPRLGALTGGQRGPFRADPGHLGRVRLAGLDPGRGQGVQAGQLTAGGAEHVRQLQVVPAPGQIHQGVLQLGDPRRVGQAGGLTRRCGAGQLGEPRGHREPGCVGEPGGVGAQQRPVVVGDAPPLGVGVHLGQREHHRVDPLAGGDQEGQLRLRQRRRRVGDEQQGGGPVHRVQGDRGVRRVETTDAGRVEQADVLQQRRRVGDLDAAGPAVTGGPVGQVGHVHRLGHPRHPRLRGERAGGEPQVRGGRHGRVDRRQPRHPQQRVDQRTLATFRLAHQHHRRAGELAAPQVGQLGAGVRVGGAHEGQDVGDGVLQILHGRTCRLSR
jgi:hypothetical protein